MKRTKKLLAVLLTAVLMLTMSAVSAFAAVEVPQPVAELTNSAFALLDDGSNPMIANPPKGKTCTLKNFAKLAQYAGQGYNHGLKGPIIITEGTLKTNGKKCDVYLVTLTGLEVPTLTPQTTDVVTVGQAGMELPNDFEKNVRKVMKKAIPKGANVVLAGHSLGGMVAQQVAANKTMQKRYNILNIVAYGAPVMFKGQIEGTMKRMGDVYDPVPYLSAETFKDFEVQDGTLQKEDSGLGLDITFAAHRNSYFDEKTWGKYDVLGFKGGDATITLNLKTQKYYASQYLFLDQLIGNFA